MSSGPGGQKEASTNPLEMIYPGVEKWHTDCVVLRSVTGGGKPGREMGTGQGWAGGIDQPYIVVER